MSQSIGVARTGIEYDRFDVQLRTYPALAEGRLEVTVDLTTGECDAIMRELADYEGGQYPYPENAREAVIEALFG